MGDQVRAALWVPRGLEVPRWAPAQAAVAEAEGWEVLSLVRDWPDLVGLICERIVDIGIIPSRQHLPPDRLPRLVPVDDWQPSNRPPLVSQRRPVINWARRGPAAS